MPPSWGNVSLSTLFGPLILALAFHWTSQIFAYNWHLNFMGDWQFLIPSKKKESQKGEISFSKKKKHTQRFLSDIKTVTISFKRIKSAIYLKYSHCSRALYTFPFYYQRLSWKWFFPQLWESSGTSSFFSLSIARPSLQKEYKVLGMKVQSN